MTDDQHDQLPMAVAPAAAQVDSAGDIAPPAGESGADSAAVGDTAVRSAAQKRRRGSRGGRNRKKPGSSANSGIATNGDADDSDEDDDDELDDELDGAESPEIEMSTNGDQAADDEEPEMPKRIGEGRASGPAAERALVRKPQIGDTRPAPPGTVAPAAVAKPA